MDNKSLTDSTIYHRRPHLPVRLGDMSKEQLKSALFVMLTHLRYRGTLRMRRGDFHQAILFDYDRGEDNARTTDDNKERPSGS
jgi:hypothetical protein